MNAIVYDCEIVKAIRQFGNPNVPGVEYCRGWSDFAGMGVSCVGVYQSDLDAYRVFCRDNLAEFVELVRTADLAIGFNNLAFDNPLLRATWGLVIPPFKSYDLLVEVWQAAGLGPEFVYPTHLGYGLDALASANGIGSKTGHGAIAPIKWQRGEIGGVIDYCLRDVWLTKRLVDRVATEGVLTNPVTGKPLTVRPPATVFDMNPNPTQKAA